MYSYSAREQATTRVVSYTILIPIEMKENSIFWISLDSPPYINEERQQSHEK
jgi:hypothetical protein